MLSIHNWITISTHPPPTPVTHISLRAQIYEFNRWDLRLWISPDYKRIYIMDTNSCTKMHVLKCFPNYHLDNKWNGSNFEIQTSINLLIKENLYNRFVLDYLLASQCQVFKINNICYFAHVNIKGKKFKLKLKESAT